MQNEKGMVRRVDELGRVVIPKELRFALHIETGTMLEFFCPNNNELYLKKFEPMRQLNDFGTICLRALKDIDCGFVLCDNVSVMAVQNLPKKDWLNMALSTDLQQKLRQTTAPYFEFATPFESGNAVHNVIVPIRAQGDLLGAIIIISNDLVASIPISSARVVANLLTDYVSR